MARYQGIIDVLIDSGNFSRVYFDHETELPSPYRGIAFLKRSALQERPGKGRELHKKWPDICAIRDGTVRVIIEEERRATEDKIRSDIERIRTCKYLWADGGLFPLDAECVLFILLNENIYSVKDRILQNQGCMKTVVICSKETFQQMAGRVMGSGVGQSDERMAHAGA